MVSHSSQGAELALIFFKIRGSRAVATRRSWQRRARLILDALPRLTDQDRHEIMVSWSHDACHRVNSPAMQKLTGRAPMPGADIDPRTLYRAAFDANGQQLTRQSAGEKKPELSRHIDHGPACNDAIFLVDPCTPCAVALPDNPRPVQPQQRRGPARLLPSLGDSGNLFFATGGNPLHPPRPALPMQAPPPKPCTLSAPPVLTVSPLPPVNVFAEFHSTGSTPGQTAPTKKPGKTRPCSPHATAKRRAALTVWPVATYATTNRPTAQQTKTPTQSTRPPTTPPEPQRRAVHRATYRKTKATPTRPTPRPRPQKTVAPLCSDIPQPPPLLSLFTIHQPHSIQPTPRPNG